MQDLRHAKPNFWPTPQDYNEAVQNVAHNVSDPELQGGLVQTGRFGLPKVVTGGFASVYKVRCAERSLAVRCLLRDVPDIQWRYQQISQSIRASGADYLAPVEFQPRGVLIKGHWFPIIKMEWVDGLTLDEYLRTADQLRQPIDPAIAAQFRDLCLHMEKTGIAHGDLQHGNILVTGGGIKLVDYDGMYVPTMQGKTSNELGHRNYQHPKRSASQFCAGLDNFSAWLIYCSLKVLAVDPGLFLQVEGGDDCLLFRQQDLADPLNSPVFAALEQHENAQLRHFGRYLRWLCLIEPTEIPGLDSPRTIPMRLLPVHAKPPAKVGQPTGLPDWLETSNLRSLPADKQKVSGSRRGPLKPNKQKISQHPTSLTWEAELRKIAAANAPPPELRQSIPRLPSRWSRAVLTRCAILAPVVISAAWILTGVFLFGQGATLIVLAVLALATQAILRGALLPWPEEEYLLRMGQLTPGVVSGKTAEPGQLWVHYVYTRNGKPLFASVAVCRTDYGRAQLGQYVNVLYDERLGDSIVYEFCTCRAITFD